MRNKGSHSGRITFKNVQLIIKREDLQNAVKRIRKSWHIPEGGFRNTKDYFNWLDSMTGNLLPSNHSEIKSITEYEFSFDGQNYFLDNIIERKIVAATGNLSEYSLFGQEIIDTCKNLKLPTFYKSFLSGYITQGKINNSIIFRSGNSYKTPIIRTVRVKNASGGEGERKIRLEFGANTELKDIEYVWHKVKKIQKTMPSYDRTRTRTNLPRDLYALQLKGEGKTHKIIHRDAPYKYSFTSEQAVAKALQRKKKIISGQ